MATWRPPQPPATYYFERTSLGPPEWDLATATVGHSSFGAITVSEYAAFCAVYGTDVTTWAEYPILRDARELRVTCFALQHAAAEPACRREQAHHRLACIQGPRGPDIGGGASSAELPAIESPFLGIYSNMASSSISQQSILFCSIQGPEYGRGDHATRVTPRTGQSLG